MKFVFVTLFPEMIRSACSWSILGRAAQEGLLSVDCVDPRDYATDRHRSVDDTTCGGGAGMVLKPQTYLAALERARELAPGALVAALTPVGESLRQERVCELARSGQDLILLCGHYEGFDERILEEADLRLSIGDFVLTGGELPALCIMDAVARFIPGVLGKQVSAEEDSFHDSLLEYPQYTRPEVWEGRAVPQVLLGGDHQKIDAWRGEQSRERTRLRRPELYEKWCETHPVTELPKWKRGENMRLVKTDEQFAAAARIFVEGRRTTCAENWTPEYCASLNEEEYLLQLRQEKAAGWVCYLHTTKDVPDGIVSINHKVGHIEHLFVTEKARGRGIGMKMLDFARRKLSEHEHPVLSVLNTNTRAIALYTRMGWKLTSGTELEFTPEQYPAVVKKCALVWMRYEGSAQK